jgi:hypothetical protein
MSFPDVRRRASGIQALPSLRRLTIAGMTPPEIEIEYLEIADLNGEILDHFDAVAGMVTSSICIPLIRSANSVRWLPFCCISLHHRHFWKVTLAKSRVPAPQRDKISRL